MKGIKKVAGVSKDLKGRYSSRYLQVNYDLENDEVFCNDLDDFGHGTTVLYKDPEIINCGILTDPATMEEIKEMVDYAVAYRQM